MIDRSGATPPCWPTVCKAGAWPNDVTPRVGSDQPGYAMPAAAWAARSGDPVLFSGRNQVPAATLAALRRHAASAVYVLGPESLISKRALSQMARVSATVQRVGVTGVVQNALFFARYTDGTFGWNINDPGHGM